MRHPVDNYKTEWNGIAGYGFNAVTSYGRHEGIDINDNGGGNSDLGKPLYAVGKGKIVSLHQHATKFGKHFLLEVKGSFGTRWFHYAHCQDIYVSVGQEVQEGQKIATVGKSGTVYAHCHFACMKNLTNMDNVANDEAELNQYWEDPINFIDNHMSEGGSTVDNNGKKAVQFDNILNEAYKRSITLDNKSENWVDDNKLCNRIFDHIDSQERTKQEQATRIADLEQQLSNGSSGDLTAAKTKATQIRALATEIVNL